MQESNTAEQAIQLIRINQEGKYILTPEASLFLSKIPGPIAAISVAGMYRTGKSYLLNRMLLNRSNGFGVGPTVNPCTKGLWCWGKAVPGKTADGQSVNVIIIDTEGIGALDEDQNHDTRIFTLAILAASSFIYNSIGSIDENALQNLSLVVNLTKSIQLNTLESQEEDDPQELAEYFPSFYWVVRDFSLQLIDLEGDTISPKQYLQRALAPQKGFTDDVQQKNRIRRLLSTFFKERQCFTLVRPLVNQKKLQHLDQLDQDELRPEFVEQVMNFRRRVLNRVKPKLLKGKQLNGQMYLCLLNSYVTAINNGAVPNIQNAWNYMCQEQCAKAFEQSLYIFNAEYGNTLKSHLPIQQQYLLDALNQIKQKSCEAFEVKAVGDQIKFHLKELRQKLQQKVLNIKLDNEKQSQIILKNYFKKNIVDIENKLKLREYGRFDEFTKDINEFYVRILDAGPNLPKKQLIYLQLIKRVVPMAAEIFIKEKNQQFEQLKLSSSQKQIQYLKIQTSLKHTLEQQEQKTKQKVTKLDRHIIELNLQLEELKKSKQLTDKILHAQQQKYTRFVKDTQDSNVEMTTKYQVKISQLQEIISSMESQAAYQKCEEQKNRAVLQMKINQLQINLQEAKKKDYALEVTLKSLQLSAQRSTKQLTDKYQFQLQNKQLLITNLKQNLTELEETKSAFELQLHNTKQSSQTNIESLSLQFKQKQSILQTKLYELEQSLETSSSKYEQSLLKLGEELRHCKNKQSILEKENKMINEDNITKQSRYKTELAVLQQKVEFLDVQNQQYKQQLTKSKRLYEEMLDEQRTRKHQEILLQQNEKINQLIEKYTSEIKQLQQQYESTLKKHSNQLQTNEKSLKDKTFELQILTTKYNTLLNQHQRIEQELTEKYTKLSQNNDSSLEKLEQQFKQKQQNYLKKIHKLEEEMQEMKEQMRRQQQEEQSKLEDSVMQLKNYYEYDKEKMEKKIIMEKEKYQKKIIKLKEEHEEKLQEEVEQLEEENQRLQDTLAELEQQLSRQRSNRKMQIDIKSKTVDNLEKALEQLRSKFDSKETDLSQRLQKIQKDHQVQKQSLYAKVQEMITSQSRLQKQKINLIHNKEQTEKIITQRDLEVKQCKEEIMQLKTRIEKEKEDAKNTRSELNTKRNEEKVELEKKVALLEQENTYIKKKLQQNEKTYGNQQQSNQQKIKRIKTQFSQQLKSLKQKSTLEYETLFSKYDKLKKNSKEIGEVFNKDKSQLEKQVAISKQRISNLTEKLNNLESKSKIQIEQYAGQLSQLKAILNKQKLQYKQAFEREHQQKERIETEKNQLQALYQQDKILWENKNKFLDENKERYKNQYEITKNQLETTIQKNRKKWNIEKISLETLHNEQLTKLEKKYYSEKQQLVETSKRNQSEYESKIKNLEFDLRAVSEKLMLEEQNKKGELNISEKKMKQLIDNERRLQIEVEKLRSIRQKELKQQQENHEKQKESIKSKYQDKEEKLKVSEKQRQHLFYEIEKQRAKWGIERDTIQNKIDQQKQIISKNQKDIEKLQRENQKLKVEKKCHKNPTSRYGFSFGQRGSSRSSLEDSILKENSNSQISDNSIFFKE